ncbi:TIR domain-containing protein [Novosphingobium sp.]|uniref:TIR domain-containing protein n=1 Tax=Novosphingobium sp. TaxID=1874826 RepID=UPI002FD88E0C
MAYRNGTYIAFHAEGKTDPTASDIKYYRMLKAWHEHDDIEFKFVNSHDKVAAVRDTSTKQTIMRSLRERLDNSKNMVLIIGETTKNDTDFVPYEIAYAVDTCKIPIICVYTGYSSILNPKSHRDEWPPALAKRIDANTVRALHIPFKQKVIDTAIGQFHLNNLPEGSLTYYTKEAQKSMGVTFSS